VRSHLLANLARRGSALVGGERSPQRAGDCILCDQPRNLVGGQRELG